MAPLKIGAIIAASAAGLMLVGLLLLFAIIPPGIHIAPTDGASEVDPGQFLEINTSRWGASLATVEVKEAKIAPDGSRQNERLLEGRLQEGKFVLADGSNPLQPDAEYTVTVSGTIKQFNLTGIRDEAVEQTHVFTTVTTPMPIISQDGIKLKYGEQVTVEWNIPIKSLDYRLEGVESTMSLEEDGRVARISLAKFEQGKEYQLNIVSASSGSDRELLAPLVTTVKTAAPLEVSFEPEDGASSASIYAHPTIIFSEAVSNPEKAQEVISVEPAIGGEFNWVAADKVEFIPAASWDHYQDVTISIAGGPQSLRGAGGGYVESDVQSTFTTAPNKSIDVNVTTQTMTLLENGNPVETILVSTGIVGLDTPLGDFTIYAKIPKTDMRGPDYFAPAVPWVLVFMGDYTIHGNYWATAFGRPSSHGCVGMPVETAKRVYEWTPIGTPVHIHR